MLDLFEVSWDRPEVSNMLAERLLTPDGDDLYRKFLGEMLRRTTDGQSVSAFFRENLRIDVREHARQLSVPTLVIQARNDEIVPVDAGRELACIDA